MKYLIAGLGSIGRRHLRNLQSLGGRDILLYRTHLATLPDDELVGLKVENDLHSALDWKPDAVIISNPTARHLDIALPAVKTGCAILIEKPVSGSLNHLDELTVLAERSGSRILIGFQFRFHPTLQKAAELIAAGAIGRVLSAHVNFGEYLPSWHPWEDYHQSYAARSDLGGGVILTQCHSLDYLPWIVGKATSLWAFSGTLGNLGIPVEDTAEIGLRFECGAIGSIHLNMIQQPPVHRLEIVGSNGTLHWDNADGKLQIYRVETKAWETYIPPGGFERNTMFLDEMRHFLDVVRGESQPRCSLQDGIKALKLALDANRSARTGKIVRLD